MLEAYRKHAEERAAQGIPALPLDAEQTSALCELLKTEPTDELLGLLRDRVPPGVDEAAYVKAGFLTGVAKKEITCSLISPKYAIELLGTMVGGYNVASLVELLGNGDAELAQAAAEALKTTLLVFDAFNDVLELSKSNDYAKQVIDSWAEGEWFTNKPEVAKEIKITVFKVPGETNTDEDESTATINVPLVVVVPPILEVSTDNPFAGQVFPPNPAGGDDFPCHGKSNTSTRKRRVISGSFNHPR